MQSGKIASLLLIKIVLKESFPAEVSAALLIFFFIGAASLLYLLEVHSDAWYYVSTELNV